MFALSMQSGAKEECVTKSSANSLERRGACWDPMVWRMVSSLETASKLNGVAAASADGVFLWTGGGTLSMDVLVVRWVYVYGDWNGKGVGWGWPYLAIWSWCVWAVPMCA